MCQSGTWSEETAAQLDERESHYDFSLPRLFAYSDYKIFKFKLSKKNYNALLDKLRLTEKYHPYADHFAIATGGRFDGIYFNGNCYGYIGPGYDSIAYDSYEDVFDSVIAIYAKRLKD